ncbi:hypothetical protein [Frankia sp. R82]|uniref:hypothetical protein n=1 Tax=Frankia sp. R82 TaxID=2950553 RepID=UPI002043ED65|nr:hypothetical protein [Frankia sp. R82]MCM3884161.1 hypothetical protein [Frankia sp. R82]
MKITRIDFGEDEEPSEITVRLSPVAAARITKWAGSLSPAEGGTEELSKVYDVLDSFFNRFWEGGADEVLQGGPR